MNALQDIYGARADLGRISSTERRAVLSSIWRRPSDQVAELPSGGGGGEGRKNRKMRA